MKVGVLALQGAFREHRWMLERCGVEAVEIRKPQELDDVAGLIIPGGESTTIGKLMIEWGLMDKIKERSANGLAIYGTCAGMILLAKEIVGSDQPRLGLMDTVVRRNAFGRQRESFEADLNVPEFGAEPVRAVFIRAPYIESAGSAVQVLATVNDKIVIARQGKFLATAFHPELTDDDRIHQYFIKMIQE
ncbi:pyridoxal 5'-phosphate synthase glutaminase subunit PdxT [Sporolituus thermophilus]|uniref:Pyridoxal 5'-phosphate synthase subunit PdxT n=1 Tax=Sporolituus thermophilus DSM 23256 TaxID=1123285 RepID=A0A1G7PDZ1_9FIRM|nr:pyridoxal 5'-phosphate synthase glutaminase subunit PdxT [Sporolituus thermophilus]SDF83869.1 pyridoxal phosphate synthase yaaE subunit [Sporolituus thermophilus DSM 23256]